MISRSPNGPGHLDYMRFYNSVGVASKDGTLFIGARQ
jgi:hypothetical protein